MAVRLSALRTGLALPPGKFLIIIYIRDGVDLRAVIRPEGFEKIV
jgi:hypothetical protein